MAQKNSEKHNKSKLKTPMVKNAVGVLRFVNPPILTLSFKSFILRPIKRKMKIFDNDDIFKTKSHSLDSKGDCVKEYDFLHNQYSENDAPSNTKDIMDAGNAVNDEENSNVVQGAANNLKDITNATSGIQNNAGEDANNDAEEEEEVILDPATNKQRVEDANEAVGKQRSTKKRWLNLIFMLINIGVVVGIVLYQFSTDDAPVSLGELFSLHINWWFFLAAIALFAAIVIVDKFRIQIMITQATKRSRPYLSYKVTALGRFYDCATPMATGGQAFQIFYLNKRGLSAGVASSTPLAKYIIGQVVFVIFAVLILSIEYVTVISVESAAVLSLCFIGLGLNLVLIFGVIFLSVSKKLAPKITKGILKLLHKMRIVKNYQVTYEKVMHAVNEYVTTFRYLISNKWCFILSVGLSFLCNLLYFSMIFIVYCMFIPFNIDMWFTLVALSLVVELAASFIPLPGGSGAAEISFTAVFVPYFTGAFIVWALLIFRFFTYYLYLFQGLIVMFYDYVRGNKKIAPLLLRFKREDEEARLKEEKRKRSQMERDEFEHSSVIVTMPRYRKEKNKIIKVNSDTDKK